MPSPRCCDPVYIGMIKIAQLAGVDFRTQDDDQRRNTLYRSIYRTRTMPKRSYVGLIYEQGAKIIYVPNAKGG